MSTNLASSPILTAFQAEADNLQARLLLHVREHVATGIPYQGLISLNKQLIVAVSEYVVTFHEGQPRALCSLGVDELISLLIGYGPLGADWENPVYR